MISLKRITSSGEYMPSLDGLRGIAILAVIGYHLLGYLQVKYYEQIPSSTIFVALISLFKNGDLGVQLFFVISGFMLGLPFAKQYLFQTEKVLLSKYYLRRLTRLEPPYFLVMSILLLSTYIIPTSINTSQTLLSYIASITYTHLIVFPKDLPLLNCVAWSLEIEIQFYVLLPLLAKLFIIKNKTYRKLIFIGCIITSIGINKFGINPIPFKNLFEYIHYFFGGLLLVDVYLSSEAKPSSNSVLPVIGIILFISLWLKHDFLPYQNLWAAAREVLFVMSIIAFYYLVLVKQQFTILSKPTLAIIGSMSYSLYLWHYPIISITGKILHTFSSAFNSTNFILLFLILALLLIALVSTCFYLIVERPCMNKNWVTTLKNNMKLILAKM